MRPLVDGELAFHCIGAAVEAARARGGSAWRSSSATSWYPTDGGRSSACSSVRRHATSIWGWSLGRTRSGDHPPGAHRCRATKRSESGSASAVLGSSPAGIICRATASIRRPGSQHRDPLLPRRHGTQHVLRHARAVRALRRELLVEHLGVDSLLDDRGALRLSREVAHANRARRAWGESLQGLAVAIDPAEYGT